MLTFVRYSRLLLAVLLFAGTVLVLQQVVLRSMDQQVRKYDNANINHMKYGLFNVNSWKEKLTSIVVSEIEDFKLNSTNKNDLKEHVQGQLSALIDKVDAQVKESNKGSTSGWIKQKLMNAFVDVDDIKKGIPGYADTIVDEMTKEQTQSELKKVVKKRVRGYLDKTFEEQDMAEIKGIMERAGVSDIEEAKVFLTKEVPAENRHLFYLTWIAIGLATALFLLSNHRTRLPATHFFLCLGTLFALLYAGVTCPMIDMDAKIAKFGFVLLGHPIEFENQIVYFQSKSILDVFWILMADPAWPMKIVGILMISFSIVFPLLKMSSAIVYYYNVLGARSSWWIKFFVLKSGKWSMTDVQIVAIMMAYIGFNGMVTSQFKTLSAYVPQVVLVSTNDTTLQIGFYLFLTYAVLAMFFSNMISKKVPPPQ